MGVPQRSGNLANGLAAGLEVATLGAVSALALLVLLSRFAGMPWFGYGNLIATGVYPATVLDERFGFWTLSGYSVGFLYFVAAGMLFAMVFHSRRRGIGPHLVGVAYALALFMVGDRLWWQLWSPYLIVYGMHAHLMWSHVAFGVVLGWLPTRRIRRDPASDTEAPSAPGSLLSEAP